MSTAFFIDEWTCTRYEGAALVRYLMAIAETNVHRGDVLIAQLCDGECATLDIETLDGFRTDYDTNGAMAKVKRRHRHLALVHESGACLVRVDGGGE